MKKVIFLILIASIITMIILNLEVFAVNTMPNVTNEMQNVDFWINKMDDANKVIMTQEEINKLNEKNFNIKETRLQNIITFTDNLSKDKLIKYLNEYSFPIQDRYMGDKLVMQSFYDDLKTQMNFDAVQEINNILYGITVKRTDIRTFPTSEQSLEGPGDIDFDMFQESTLEVAQPVRILHKSLDSKWYFIQATDYLGWIKSEDVATAKDRTQLQEYLTAKDFIVITTSKIILPVNPYCPKISELRMGMGTKLPVILSNSDPIYVGTQISVGNYIVLVPTKGENDELVIEKALIPVVSDVSVGYLPYTRANILKQVFKSLGDHYGWGGMYNSRDCSSLAVESLRCFGIIMPRNSTPQEISTGKDMHLTSDDDIQKRYQKLDTMPAGSILYMKNHVMMYIGKDNDKYYMIHSSGSMGDPNFKNPDGSLKKIPINCVVVSDLDIFSRRNGRRFIEWITTIKNIECHEPVSNLLDNSTQIPQDATQAIVVTTSGANTIYAKLNAYEKVDGKWTKALPEMDARIGKNGIKETKNQVLSDKDKLTYKYEGDGCTPAGVYKIGTLFGWGENQGFKMPYKLVTENDYWISEPQKDEYNIWATREGGPDEKWTDYEKLLIDPYKYAAVIEYNTGEDKVVGNGSAIFLHITSSKGYTAGCTGLCQDDIIKLFKWLDSGKNPVIIQTPEYDMGKYM